MDATLAIAADPAARVILLTGAGKRFCGGRRPQGLRRSRRPPHPPARDPGAAARRRSPSSCGAPRRSWPRCRGARRAPGMGLVGASDLVLAGESAKFVMAYTGVGLTPDGSSSWFLPRLVGLRRALELTFTNRVLSAAEAKEWGLITDVVPDDQLADGGRGPRGAARRGPRARAGRGEAAAPHEPRIDAGVAPRPRGRGDLGGVGHARGAGGRRRVRREADAGVQPRMLDDRYCSNSTSSTSCSATNRPWGSKRKLAKSFRNSSSRPRVCRGSSRCCTRPIAGSCGRGSRRRPDGTWTTDQLLVQDHGHSAS